MADTVRFGIIGCGGISTAHLDAVAQIDGAEAVAAADINEAALNEKCDAYGVSARHTDWRDVVARDDVDAVAVCLPHNLHRPVAVEAARQGKHVLGEKPMAMSLAECDDMIRAAEENDVVLMVAQVLRRYPSHTLAKQWIGAGRIGRVANVIRRRIANTASNLERYDWADSPEVAGGWMLYGYGAHEYDAVLWLLDTHATQVFAVGTRNKPVWRDYDEISAVFRLASGATATVLQSLNAHQGAWDCLVIGDKGSLTIRTQEVELNGEVTPAPIAPGVPFREQVQEFVDCVRSGNEPGPSGRNVRSTMQLLEAVKLSLAESRPVNAEEL